MAVAAKFFVKKVVNETYRQFDEHTEPEDALQTIVTLAAVTDSPDNKSWSKFTPSGEITMHITNTAASKQFEVGSIYTVTFQKSRG